jgi:hypothetical protein
MFHDYVRPFETQNNVVEINSLDHLGSVGEQLASDAKWLARVLRGLERKSAEGDRKEADAEADNIIRTAHRETPA